MKLVLCSDGKPVMQSLFQIKQPCWATAPVPGAASKESSAEAARGMLPLPPCRQLGCWGTCSRCGRLTSCPGCNCYGVAGDTGATLKPPIPNTHQNNSRRHPLLQILDSCILLVEQFAVSRRLPTRQTQHQTCRGSNCNDAPRHCWWPAPAADGAARSASGSCTVPPSGLDSTARSLTCTREMKAAAPHVHAKCRLQPCTLRA